MKGFLTILFLLNFLITVTGFSQEVKYDQIIVEQGRKYIIHSVRTGETLFSISKKFNSDLNELELYNPGIKKGIQIGQEIKIPYVLGIKNETEENPNQKSNPIEFKIHKIESKSETLYSISKKYGISVEEIYHYNPGIKAYKKGTKIKIPVWGKAEIAKKEEIREVEKETLVEKDKPGSLFLEHIIGSGETMYGLTKRYKVSEEELIELNPELKDKFPAGMIIKIPVREVPKPKTKPINNLAFKKHNVLKGETLFGLADFYDIEIDEIVKYNQDLETRGLIEGETILIPQRPSSSVNRFIPGDKADSIKFYSEYYKLEKTDEIPKGCNEFTEGHFSSKTCEFALFLPLYINDYVSTRNNKDLMESETETEKSGESIEESKTKGSSTKIITDIENFLQFYEGTMIAIDQLQKKGMKIKMNVYDYRNSSSSIQNVLDSPGFKKNKLIIGPVTHELQTEVSAFSEKNNIPMVSPLANASPLVKGNPWYFQINPDKEYVAEKTAEIIAFNHFRNNIIILSTESTKDTPEKRISELIQEKIASLSYTNKVSGVKAKVINISNGQLENNLSKQKENVIFIESSVEGTVGSLLQKLKTLSSDYPITLIAPNHRFMQQFPSVETEFFHQLKLEYISAYWTDYTNSATIGFYEKFRENFSTEPNNYGIQGYDIAYYFLSALNFFGEDFRECIPTLDLELVQGTYSFEKVSKGGGFKNEGVSVIALGKDYSIKRKRIIGANK